MLQEQKDLLRILANRQPTIMMSPGIRNNFLEQMRQEADPLFLKCILKNIWLAQLSRESTEVQEDAEKVKNLLAVLARETPKIKAALTEIVEDGQKLVTTTESWNEEALSIAAMACTILSRDQEEETTIQDSSIALKSVSALRLQKGLNRYQEEPDWRLQKLVIEAGFKGESDAFNEGVLEAIKRATDEPAKKYIVDNIAATRPDKEKNAILAQYDQCKEKHRAAYSCKIM
jgi:hypothetical protein